MGESIFSKTVHNSRIFINIIRRSFVRQSRNTCIIVVQKRQSTEYLEIKMFENFCLLIEEHNKHPEVL